MNFIRKYKEVFLNRILECAQEKGTTYIDIGLELKDKEFYNYTDSDALDKYEEDVYELEKVIIKELEQMGHIAELTVEGIKVIYNKFARRIIRKRDNKVIALTYDSDDLIEYLYNTQDIYVRIYNSVKDAQYLSSNDKDIITNGYEEKIKI